jgi:diaminohydroxyphosphoribosylaminopyrimidine deaminase/5-amino-6-(5-phosphoribosylamino)uracil reductase
LEGAKVFEIDAMEPSHFLEKVLLDLGKRKIKSIQVEGGSLVLGSFVGSGLWNEARVFRNPSLQLPKGLQAPRLSAREYAVARCGSDEIRTYFNETKHETK